MAIAFLKQQEGYNCQQVDTVLRGLEDQYRNLYEQYSAVEAQCQEQLAQVAALRSANDQLAEQLRDKQHETAQLSERVRGIEASAKSPANTQSESMLREIMVILIRQAAAMITDAKKEAEGIINDARTDRDAMQAVLLKAFPDIQRALAAGKAAELPAD